MKFYTANNKEVTNRIEDGMTKLFKCPKEAQEHAKNTRSYIYEVLTTNKQNNMVFAGYGVPK